MEGFKIQSADSAEVFQIQLDPVKHPIAYSHRVESLVGSGLPRSEAEREALMPIDMEMFYDPGAGCFAVESEAIECTDIYNPYNGSIIEVDEL